MSTITLASIYESQGYKRDAFEIYWKILEDDPTNIAAKNAIDRLGRVREVFTDINSKKREIFISMKSSEQFLEFEKWLVEKWS